MADEGSTHDDDGRTVGGFRTRLNRLREEHPVLDHVIRMQEHYGATKGSQQAGAVTYFAFLSFFPILALAFFVVGYVSDVWPVANENLVAAIDSVLPGVIGPAENQISLDDVRTFSGVAGIVGLLGVLYSGLGWVSSLRDALIAVFELPDHEQPSFVLGKLRDLVTLVLIGVVLIVAVALAGFVSGFSADVVGWIGLGSELGWLVKVVALVIGLGANVVLFFVLFRLLADPDLPTGSLWQGALLGAVGFELLKQLSGVLLASTTGQPAFQAFGIALILVVWINYFSRLVVYAASWAYTTPEARARRQAHPAEPVQGPALPSGHDRAVAVVGSAAETEVRPPQRAWPGPFAAGAAAMLALVGIMRRTTRH